MLQHGLVWFPFNQHIWRNTNLAYVCIFVLYQSLLAIENPGRSPVLQTCTPTLRVRVMLFPLKLLMSVSKPLYSYTYI